MIINKLKLIKNNADHTTQETKEIIYISYMTVLQHLYMYKQITIMFGSVNLTEKKSNDSRFHLLTCNKNIVFLKRMIKVMKNGLFTTMYSKKVLEIKWATIKHCKCLSASEESDAVYLVGLEGYCVRVPSAKIRYVSWQVLFSIHLIKGSSQWKASRIG